MLDFSCARLGHHRRTGCGKTACPQRHRGTRRPHSETANIESFGFYEMSGFDEEGIERGQ